MLTIPDERVEILPFPESSAAFERQISHPRAGAFPKTEQLRERARPNVHHQMHMIRHHHPGLQLIGLAVTFAQLLFDERREVRAPKPALAVAAIQPRFELAAALRLLLLVQQALPLATARDGKGVVQHEGDELSDVRRVEM